MEKYARSKGRIHSKSILCSEHISFLENEHQKNVYSLINEIIYKNSFVSASKSPIEGSIWLVNFTRFIISFNSSTQIIRYIYIYLLVHYFS